MKDKGEEQEEEEGGGGGEGGGEEGGGVHTYPELYTAVAVLVFNSKEQDVVIFTLSNYLTRGGENPPPLHKNVNNSGTSSPKDLS